MSKPCKVVTDKFLEDVKKKLGINFEVDKFQVEVINLKVKIVVNDVFEYYPENFDYKVLVNMLKIPDFYYLKIELERKYLMRMEVQTFVDLDTKAREEFLKFLSGV
jgi:hypothetical protein